MKKKNEPVQARPRWRGGASPSRLINTTFETITALSRMLRAMQWLVAAIALALPHTQAFSAQCGAVGSFVTRTSGHARFVPRASSSRNPSKRVAGWGTGAGLPRPRSGSRAVAVQMFDTSYILGGIAALGGLGVGIGLVYVTEAAGDRAEERGSNVMSEETKQKMAGMFMEDAEVSADLVSVAKPQFRFRAVVCSCLVVSLSTSIACFSCHQ